MEEKTKQLEDSLKTCMAIYPKEDEDKYSSSYSYSYYSSYSYSPSCSPPRRTPKVDLRPRSGHPDRERVRSRSRSGNQRRHQSAQYQEREKACIPFVCESHCPRDSMCQYSHPNTEDCKRLRRIWRNTPCKYGKDCTHNPCYFKHDEDAWYRGSQFQVNSAYPWLPRYAPIIPCLNGPGCRWGSLCAFYHNWTYS